MTPMSDERLAEIEARDQAATPGPWAWFGNTDVRDACLATPDRGRLYVMQFARWGMASAQPVFRDDAARQMVKASEVPVYEVAPKASSRDDPRVYRADISGFRNPDAEFIAHARQDVTDLLAEVGRLREQLSTITEQRDRLVVAGQAVVNDHPYRFEGCDTAMDALDDVITDIWQPEQVDTDD